MNSDSSLIDPSLLEGLTEEQRQEALAAARAAKRAEERAEARALERALQRKERERQREREQEKNERLTTSLSTDSGNRIKFVSKRLGRSKTDANSSGRAVVVENVVLSKPQKNGGNASHISPSATSSVPLSKREREAIKETYLGKSQEELEEEEAAKRKKQRSSKKITFKFRWDDTDDTFQDDDPLYAPMRQSTLKKKRSKHENDILSKQSSSNTSVDHLLHKPLSQMKVREWRILRENYEIVVKGGKTPPPLRHFRENPDPDNLPDLHSSLLDAIDRVLKFKQPSPIQRQACTLGLQRRDMIGLAETGSGKTVAFGLPLCHYLLNLPDKVLASVADSGPLALVMAPTRELALQIDVEISKLLSLQRKITTCAVVGGQPIQQQAQKLRKGVHMVVGTPGRINDCIEMAYMVLNQCCYVVLDEGDRMIDMGFLPQVESILESMGGKLKSEDEREVYQQEQEDLKIGGVATYRITAMFSATMPLEVETIAKRYLRHPAIVSVGDRKSGKNSRIVQKLVWVASEAQKEKVLKDLLINPRFLREKVIVFVNEKKHTDSVGRMVERAGRSCVVMHGGKSQEHREESLDKFRRGGYVLVCTDVAGRGIDIPNVAHVINFNLPTRSIETYTHRIGRTGRAGKEGVATSLISDEDEGIMAALKEYLENTGNQVPERLARHPAASSKDQGHLIF